MKKKRLSGRPPLFCQADQTSVRPLAKEASHRAYDQERSAGFRVCVRPVLRSAGLPAFVTDR